MERHELYFEVEQRSSYYNGQKYDHMKVTLSLGEEPQEDGQVSASPVAVMTWQRDGGEQPGRWYAFSMEMAGYHSNLDRMSEGLSCLKRIDGRIEKITHEEQAARGNGCYWVQGFGSDTTPEQVGEALRRLKVRQVVRDHRAADYVLVDQVRPANEMRYWPNMGDEWLYCSFTVWAVGETQAKAEIMKAWSSKLAECVTRDRECAKCSQLFVQWVSQGMAVRFGSSETPKVDTLPAWTLPEPEVKSEEIRQDDLQAIHEEITEQPVEEQTAVEEEVADEVAA